MKIGILGSGDARRKRADGFSEIGHTVKIGSRDPNQKKVAEWIAKHNKRNVSSGTFAETASFGELDVLATLWARTSNAIKMADAKNLVGKVVIDVYAVELPLKKLLSNFTRKTGCSSGIQ